MTPDIEKLISDLRASGTRNLPKNNSGVYMSICDKAADALAFVVREREAVRDKLIERVDAIIETLQFNSRHMIAERSLQDAWKMLDMAREQWAIDANTWIAFREELRRSLSSEERQ